MDTSFDMLAWAEEAARTIAKDFTPDGDWAPMLFYWTGEKFHITPVVIEENNKSGLALALQITLMTHKAIEAVLLTSSWVVNRDKDIAVAELEKLLPSREPDRREVLVFTHVTKDKTEMHMAPIERHDDSAPTLGSLIVDTEVVVGRFVDAMRKGIR